MSAAEVVVRVVGQTIQKCKSKRLKRKLKKRRMNMKRRNNRNRFVSAGNYSENAWFWQSYQKALEWQGKHYIAYWRAKCIALQEENRVLKDYLTKISTSSLNHVQWAGCFSTNNKVSRRQPETKNKTKLTTPFAVSSENGQIAKETEDYKFEFEINEEMLDFFEQSMRHKMERDRLKNAKEKKEELSTHLKSEENEDSDILPPKKQVGQQRIEEMKLLYGKAAPMIMGMETALQLTFDRNVDKLQPPMWPNIPLKL